MNPIEASIGRIGKQIYNELEKKLVSSYPKQYVAIEPTTGDYFIGKTLGEAITKAKQKYPDRLFYTTPIGVDIRVPTAR